MEKAAEEKKNRKRNWTDDEAIALLQNRAIIHGSEPTLRGAMLTSKIQAKMQEEGYNRSTAEISKKMQNLLKDYKAFLAKYGKSGSAKCDKEDLFNAMKQTFGKHIGAVEEEEEIVKNTMNNEEEADESFVNESGEDTPQTPEEVKSDEKKPDPGGKFIIKSRRRQQAPTQKCLNEITKLTDGSAKIFEQQLGLEKKRTDAFTLATEKVGRACDVASEYFQSTMELTALKKKKMELDVKTGELKLRKLQQEMGIIEPITPNFLAGESRTSVPSRSLQFKTFASSSNQMQVVTSAEGKQMIILAPHRQ
ncbi:uncharacterized protein LOC132195938 isoform X2 [Neocloeon triangulifer]|uniref:uncharacterized protein LOC132195938 isoform X2 n=1 Tax=Neocloeon triangulifer TaxID=2078957 RepID=UPI00286F7289|nr:uncharacterized protein LOC132195938 isoform X2 [Neocloeon triangulifer]